MKLSPFLVIRFVLAILFTPVLTMAIAAVATPQRPVASGVRPAVAASRPKVSPQPRPTPQLLREGDGTAILNMILAPDGQTLLAGDARKGFALDLATGQASTTFKAIPGQAGSLSPDGKEMLSPRYDFWLHIFNAQTGEQRAEILPMAVGFPSETVWSPNGKQIAVASANQVDLLDAQSTKKIAQTMTPIGTGAHSVAFSPDGSRLAAGFTSKVIETYSTGEFDKPGFTANTHIGGPRLKVLQTLSGHGGAVDVLRWSKDGSLLFAGDASGSVSIWDIATAKRRAEVPLSDSGVTDIAVAPSGQTLAVAAPGLAGGASLILCDIAKAKPKLVWNGKSGDKRIAARRVLFAPDGKSLLVGTALGAIWRVPVGALDWFKAPPPPTRIDSGTSWTLAGDANSVQALVFSPDGRFVVAADHTGTLGRWDVATGAKTRLASGHSQSITTLAFAPNGNILASGGWSGLEVLDWNTGQALWRVDGKWSGVGGFSRDGKILYASVDSLLKAFDARSGRELKTIGSGGKAQKIALSPDGQHLAVASVSGLRGSSVQEILQVWNVETTQQEWSVPFGGYIRSLVWSSDSKLLAFDNGDRADGYEDGYTFNPGQMGYSVLDAATGQNTALSNLNLKEPVAALAFAPSGKFLFVSSERLRAETVLLSLPEGLPVPLDAERQALLPSHAASVAFSPDSKLLAAGFAGGPLRIVRLN